LLAGAALAGLVACASVEAAPTPPSANPPVCNAGVCKVEITVADCGASGGITVNPAEFAMPTGSGPAVVHWKILTPGHVFAPEGIRFDPPTAQFQRLPGGPANEIRMRNDRSARGDFHYSVDVRNCVPVDPFIRNF
jgi:hypothetical protein